MIGYSIDSLPCHWMQVICWIAGFAVSLGLGDLITRAVVLPLWRELTRRDRERCERALAALGKGAPAEWTRVNPEANFSRLVGIVERLLYTGALLASRQEFIGVWLGIKVIARWQTNPHDEKPIDSDNIWLVGSGLSLLLGYLGYLISRYAYHFLASLGSPVCR